MFDVFNIIYNTMLEGCNMHLKNNIPLLRCQFALLGVSQEWYVLYYVP